MSYNNLTNKINCLRDKIAELGRLEDPYHVAYDIAGSLFITLVFYIILPGKLLPFIYTWIIWELFILSLSRDYYDPIRRFSIVITSTILYILLEVIRSFYKRKAFF
jgi:hypothetical protein